MDVIFGFVLANLCCGCITVCPHTYCYHGDEDECETANQAAQKPTERYPAFSKFMGRRLGGDNQTSRMVAVVSLDDMLLLHREDGCGGLCMHARMNPVATRRLMCIFVKARLKRSHVC